MSRRGLAASCGLALALAAPASPVTAEELTVSVAISMKEVVETLGREFVRGRPGAAIRYNAGASGELQHQIEAGAPVDVFLSAAERQMDELAAKRLIVLETRHVIARNVLVVVVPADAAVRPTRPADLLDPRLRRVAIGNPRTVPAGQYAEASLRRLALWEPLRPKLVFAENVRQVLEYVGRGEVDAGFVYATDVPLRAPRVQEAFRPPLESYPPARCAAAVVTGSRHPGLARAFVEALTRPEAQALLARFGFQRAPR